MREGKPETLAKVILSQNVVGSKDLRALLDILPSELPHEVADASECGHLSMSKSFQVGSFVHGEVQGVRSSARKFPLPSYAGMSSSCSRTCGLAQSACSGTSWPFLIRILVMNIALTAPLQQFLPSIKVVCGYRELEVGSAKVKGTVTQVDRRGFRFDGSRLRATMPWKGRRDVVVAYLAKDVGKLNDVDKAFLIDLGFPLDPATCVSRCGPRPKDKVRAVIGVDRTPDKFSLLRKQCKSSL